MIDLKKEIEKIKRIEKSGHHLRMSQYYGMDNIFKAYTDLPSILPVHYTLFLEHGITIMPDYINDKIKNSRSEIIFVNTSHRKKYLSSIKNKSVEILGPLAIHYRRMNGVVKSQNVEGTLIFPSHSTHYVDSVFNWEVYADSLLKLPDEFKPLTICLYWKDFVLGRENIFIDRGFEVTTNGHIYDSQHIHNTYENLKSFKYVSGNSITSAFFYAMELGIPAFRYGESVTLDSERKEMLIVKSENDNAYINKAYRILDMDPHKQKIKFNDNVKGLLDFYIDEPNWVTKDYARKITKEKFIFDLSKKAFNYLMPS